MREQHSYDRGDKEESPSLMRGREISEDYSLVPGKSKNEQTWIDTSPKKTYS